MFASKTNGLQKYSFNFRFESKDWQRKQSIIYKRCASLGFRVAFSWIFRFDRITLLSKKTQIARYKGAPDISREINVQKKFSPLAEESIFLQSMVCF